MIEQGSKQKADLMHFACSLSIQFENACRSSSQDCTQTRVEAFCN